MHLILTRRQQGDCHGLIEEFKLYHGHFSTYFRVSVQQFELLLVELRPQLRRWRNNFREPIDPEQILAVCLR